MAKIKYIPGTRNAQDITGLTFGRLVAEQYIGVQQGHHCWLCRCSCGKAKVLPSGHLRSGATKSCGCLHDEVAGDNNRTHGLSKTYFDRIRLRMLGRCYNRFAHNFKHYGGRGISVCTRWRESLVAFAEDMGPRPTIRHTLDRIDNNGNYEPSNCRWATKVQQMRNTRTNTLIEFRGKTQCLKAWSIEIGVNASTLCNRLYKFVERAFTTSTRSHKPYR
jgi:hypothetical protein